MSGNLWWTALADFILWNLETRSIYLDSLLYSPARYLAVLTFLMVMY